MQAQPPQIPVLPISIPLAPLPQSWAIADGNVGDEKVLWCTFVSPLSAQIVVLDYESAIRLADELHARASGLRIVRGNGSGGLPNLGDFKP